MITEIFRSRINSAITRHICSLLNTEGGTIYIGISPKTKSISLIDIKEEKKRLNEYLRRYKITPSYKRYVTIEEEIRYEGKVLVIKVDKSELCHKVDGDILVRQNNRIIQLLSEEKLYEFRLVNDGVFDRITNYLPSDLDKRKQFMEESLKQKVKYMRVGHLGRRSYFKYMDLEAALLCLGAKSEYPENSQSIRFVEPSCWQDQYESRFYNADYKNIKGYKTSTTKLHACCMTIASESESAWKNYVGLTGLKSKCVQFEIDIMKFRYQLINALSNCTVYEGRVNYMSPTVLNSLHLSTKEDKSENKDFKHYFDHFSRNNFIRLLLLKRLAFEHESEVRFLIVNNLSLSSSSVKPQKYVKIDWIDVIEGVRIGSDATALEIKLLQDALYYLAEKKKSKMSLDEYEKLLKRLEVKPYDVYQDELANSNLTVGMTYDDWSNRVITNQGKTILLSKREKLLYDYLLGARKRSHNSTIPNIAKAIGYSVVTVRIDLYSLKRKGIVKNRNNISGTEIWTIKMK